MDSVTVSPPPYLGGYELVNARWLDWSALSNECTAGRVPSTGEAGHRNLHPVFLADQQCFSARDSVSRKNAPGEGTQPAIDASLYFWSALKAAAYSSKKPTC